MRGGGNLASIEPVVTLKVGPGNVFGQRPRMVLGREADVVTVECDDGVRVLLDFRDLATRKRTSQGEYVYRGGLDEGNDGGSWMLYR